MLRQGGNAVDAVLAAAAVSPRPKPEGLDAAEGQLGSIDEDSFTKTIPV